MRGRHNGHRPFRPPGCHPPSQPPFEPSNPNFAIQDPNVLQFLQALITPVQPNFALQQRPNNFFFQNPNAYSLPQNSIIPTRQQPQQVNNPSSSQSQLHNHRGGAASGQVPKEVQERANQAVNQAWRELIATGNTVTAWKVSEAALVALQADSWSSLGLDMQGIPSLQRLMAIEGRVNAFIQCFAGVRRITTLYELELAICENEGVRTYEKLELGPLLRHPLILRYFSVKNCTEVFKITSEDIIAHIHEFIDGHKNQEILIDEFLDFVADKQAATSKEMLGVRIRSLAMYTSFIKKADGKRDFEVKKCQKGLKLRKRRKGLKLKERYMNISQEVESFMSVHKDFCGKHIRFDSSSTEEEDASDSAHENERNDNDEGSDSELPSEVISSSHRVSSCPYPSAAEELIRLGLKDKMPKPSPATASSKRSDCTGPYKRKRKIDSPSPSISRPPKLSRRDGLKQATIPNENGDQSKDLGSLDEADILLSDNLMKTFITTWKEACREHTMAEVLQRMLCFYSSTAQKRKKMKSMLSSYPFIGLLNVAVTSIKKGMWDSIYDTIQAVRKLELTTTSDNCSEHESIDVEPSEKDALIPTSIDCVTVEDVIKKINAYFKHNQEIGKSLKEQKLVLLRKLFNCESWLAEQFYVKDFKSLALGEFFMFLERHASLLPIELQKLLAAEICEKSPLEVCILQHLLIAFISQASYNLQDNQIITKEVINELLMKQCPLFNFKVKENGSMEDFLEFVEKSKNDISSKCVIFSASLLGTCHDGHSLAYDENYSSETSVQNLRKVKSSAASKDAMAVLLRAPMLSDLYSWSHWDILFAPSLGSLIVWLFNEVRAKELLCLVTKDGKVVRIDQSATIDSFLEAALKGSAFETALVLLSLCSITGGIKHLPLALLRHHAQMAFEVLLKNQMDKIEADDYRNSIMNGKAPFRPKFREDVSVGNLANGLHINSIEMKKAASHASRFFLDCLCYLPSEFHGCAADILLHGMRAVIKNCPSAILSACNELNQRVMLHELGFSLGIVEWIQDYHVFCSTDMSNLFLSSEKLGMKTIMSELKTRSNFLQNAIDRPSYAEKEMIVSDRTDKKAEVCDTISCEEVSAERMGYKNRERSSEVDEQTDAALVIESIRRDEFGLDPSLSSLDSSLLKKQHARLGRALHCLSQELYSQDSHFLLELVQNADDNVYSENEEPTLTFIVQESGIIVLNNEQGFSAQNIRALCDVGSSTKKGCSGYIGRKGIGFKSVFRVTDAPEIHSNGFHVKFDISDGQIGFVLPTLVPPCNVDSFKMLLGGDTSQLDNKCWNTCIILPFRSVTSKGNDMNNIVSMFSDLHPSLLLFLHRIQCIVFRNMLNDSFVVMRKEIVGNGIVKVSCGVENMTWFVASQKLQANIIHRDVQITEISIAFTLLETDCGCYKPFLDQQPVFAFLPLRTYGLKFILQGDFVLPSSREEVDVDSPWNQWLLSEYPILFVSAERSFCSLPCFRENPGKAVSVYLSFVPLVGEVHGFFSSLPRMIISKLRMSNCLILEGDKSKWVPSCKVLRGWTESARKLFPDSLLHDHLGLGYLDKDIILSDALARALGIQDYGPEVLVQIISSLCKRGNGLKPMGLAWISSWLNEFYAISFQSSGQASMNCEIETVLVETLRKTPFIPLSDGTFSSVDEGTIWLYSDVINTGFEGDLGLEAFPTLYAKLRFVSPALFSESAVSISCVGNITSVLHNIGVQQLSAHEIIKVHILPDMSDERVKTSDKNLMIDYLCFVMIHLQSSCPCCRVERDYIISDLRNKAFILTNYGFKRPIDVSVHFSKEFENPVNINRLINGVDLKWHEVDKTYLKHPAFRLLSSGLKKWREFFLEIGVTDFVQVVQLDKSFVDMSHTVLQSLSSDCDLISHGSVVKDWESYELVQLLSLLSGSGNREGCKYLLEVLDEFWDVHFSEKAIGCCNFKSGTDIKPFRSSFLCKICEIPWVVSSMDDKLRYPKELFHDCDAVRAILGACAPYAVPKVRNGKLVKDIGFRTEVTIDDALKILKLWRSNSSFKASVAQMSRLYTFIWSEVRNSRKEIAEEFHAASSIFVPYKSASRPEDVVSGLFLSSKEVYWHDSTGAMDQMYNHSQSGSSENQCPLNRTLSNIYPGLFDFFVNECKVPEKPSFCNYLDILLQLSAATLPSQAAHAVFQVFLKWADALKSGLLSTEDIHHMKECLNKSEYTVLPTVLDKWVSLHPSFGLVCWCDDEKLKKRFKHLDNIDFLYFGTLNDSERELLQTKVSILIRTFGIPVLSEVVTREAIYSGRADGRFKASLVNWALPFAQRYLYSVHPDKYIQLKQSGFSNISDLQIVVVDELYYRNVIKSCGIVSKKKFQCSCLLQDNILYTTPESDSHAVYMELSCLLFDGMPDLQLANFLHMVTTMAISGSNEEQTEFFILNSQRMPKLPDEEPVWSLSSVTCEAESNEFLESSATTEEKEQPTSKSKKMSGIYSNWPPVDWKTAPGLSKRPTPISQLINGSEHIDLHTSSDGPVAIDTDMFMEDNTETTSPIPILPDSESLDHQYGETTNPTGSGVRTAFGTVDSGVRIAFDPVDLSLVSENPQLVSLEFTKRNQLNTGFVSSEFSQRDQLLTGTPNTAQALLTGKLGELAAFKYFTGTSGKKVKWVNKDHETGLPYDLVVEDERGHIEYVEVKATKSARKDWFNISTREWQFAAEKGDSFSIAHVFLLSEKDAKIAVYSNPIKLCQLGKLQLVVLMPRQRKDSTITS